MPPQALIALLAIIPVAAMLLLGAQVSGVRLASVARRPRAFLVGLAGQLLLLPALAAAFWVAYPGPDSVKASAFVVAAVPGGTISNLTTFWGRGRLALSVALTAASTVAGVVTIPLWTSVGTGLADGGGGDAVPALSLAARSFAVLVVPLAVGMAVRHRWPEIADRLEVTTRRAMPVLIAAIIGTYTAARWEHILAAFTPAVIAGALLFNVLAVLGGRGLAHSAGLDRPDGFTVAIEVGIQNVVVGMLVVEALGRPDLLPFIGVYALVSVTLLYPWVRLLGGPARPGRSAVDTRGAR